MPMPGPKRFRDHARLFTASTYDVRGINSWSGGLIARLDTGRRRPCAAMECRDLPRPAVLGIPPFLISARAPASSSSSHASVVVPCIRPRRIETQPNLPKAPKGWLPLDTESMLTPQR